MEEKPTTETKQKYEEALKNFFKEYNFDSIEIVIRESPFFESDSDKSSYSFRDSAIWVDSVRIKTHEGKIFLLPAHDCDLDNLFFEVSDQKLQEIAKSVERAYNIAKDKS